MKEATTDWAESDTGRPDGIMVMWGTIFVPSSILSVIYEYVWAELLHRARSNGMVPPGFPLILASHLDRIDRTQSSVVPCNNRKIFACIDLLSLTTYYNAYLIDKSSSATWQITEMHLRLVPERMSHQCCCCRRYWYRYDRQDQTLRKLDLHRRWKGPLQFLLFLQMNALIDA